MRRNFHEFQRPFPKWLRRDLWSQTTPLCKVVKAHPCVATSSFVRKEYQFAWLRWFFARLPPEHTGAVLTIANHLCPGDGQRTCRIGSYLRNKTQKMSASNNQNFDLWKAIEKDSQNHLCQKNTWQYFEGPEFLQELLAFSTLQNKEPLTSAPNIGSLAPNVSASVSRSLVLLPPNHSEGKVNSCCLATSTVLYKIDIKLLAVDRNL